MFQISLEHDPFSVPGSWIPVPDHRRKNVQIVLQKLFIGKKLKIMTGSSKNIKGNNFLLQKVMKQMKIFHDSGSGSGFLPGFGSRLEKLRDLDPDPVCPERLDPDPEIPDPIRNPA